LGHEEPTILPYPVKGLFGKVGPFGNRKALKIPKSSVLIFKEIAKFVASDDHVLCLTKWGGVYAWGSNDCRQLGLKASSEVVLEPELVQVTCVPNTVVCS